MHSLLSVILSLCLFVSLSLSSTTRELDLYLYTEDEVNKWGSRCLDGSPAGFYFGAATNPEYNDKWVIYLSGGGFCLPDVAIDVPPCSYYVTKSLGSSKHWPKTNGGSYFPVPVLDYTQVYLEYCSGDLYSGTRNESESGYYFAGHNNIVAMIQKLKESYGLDNATEIILSGSSAGGIGTFVNIDYVQSQFSSNVSIMSYPNAGWFIMIKPYDPVYVPLYTIGKEIYDIGNGYVNQACAKAYPGEEYLCISGNYSYPFVTAPMFIAQSLFDQEQLVYQDGSGSGFTNPDENQYKVAFGKLMKATLQQTFNNPDTGLFATPNFTHEVPYNNVVNGQLMNSVFQNWYQRTGEWKIESSCDTPNCAVIPL